MGLKSISHLRRGNTMPFQGKRLALVIMLLILGCHCHATLPPSFGNAHRFHPLPETVVGAHCPWEVRLNTVFNRVPPVITEIVCLSPHSMCGGNANFKCRQINSKMTVGYTFPHDHTNIEYMRNTTIAVGCSCVMN